MVIFPKTGRILDDKSEALLIPVHCVSDTRYWKYPEIARAYPEIIPSYQQYCHQDLIQPGKLWAARVRCKLLICFAVQWIWDYPCEMEWIEAGLAKISTKIQTEDITSIAIPEFGSGDEWGEIKPHIISTFSSLACDVYIYENN